MILVNSPAHGKQHHRRKTYGADCTAWENDTSPQFFKRDQRPHTTPAHGRRCMSSRCVSPCANQAGSLHARNILYQTPGTHELSTNNLCSEQLRLRQKWSGSVRFGSTYLKAVVRHTVRANEVHAVGLQHPGNFHAHLGDVGGRTLSAQNRVQGSLVDHGVERLVRVIQRTDVHHLPHESWLVPEGVEGVTTEHFL